MMMKILRTLLEILICDNAYVDHCHIIGKNKGSVYRACNINIILNHKVPIALYNIKNYDSHLIMQKLGKFNFKINLIPNRLESSVY